MIKISNELSLPNDAVTQTMAQIGRKGAGKTYLASMIAEKMLDAQAQVIIIDPIGNWWGLRVDEDGKSKGKEIFIIGGSHGDVPLASEGGKEIAKLLVEKNISIILDISEFRKNERKKFVTDFAEEFYHLKKGKSSAVHIFLEESQKFVPQRVQKDDARMLGAWEDIVRLGRNYGIGCSLISQRPQSVNKEVLSQVECLFVLQITGLHERKALEEWVQEAGEDRSIVGHLPSLKTGQGYVWSPSWLRIFKKVEFDKKTTFDTSATPKLGEATKSAKISKMDIEKLREQMTNVIEKVNKEKLDRKILVDENKRLTTELKKRPKEQVVKEVIRIDENSLQKAKEEGFKEAERTYKSYITPIEQNTKRLQQSIIKLIKDAQGLLNSNAFIMVGDLPAPEIKPVNVKSKIKEEVRFSKPLTQVTPKSNYVKPELPARTNLLQVSDNPYTDSGERIGGGALKILKACAMLHPKPISKARMGAIAGISHKTGSFGVYLATLRRNSLITGKADENYITEEGLDKVGDFEPMPTDSDSMISNWIKIVGGGAGRILKVLTDAYPESLSKEEVAEQAGGISPNTGSFGVYLAKLRRNDLIVNDGSNLKASEEMFE